MNYAFLIDNTSCIGCHACSTACKSEHQVPLGVFRTWVKSVEVGRFPEVRRTFQVTRCNHCSAAPCVRICPTAAMHRRPDGIVDFDSDACIGCKGCIQACPYDAIHIDPESHTAAKCNFCAHRIDVGLEPACVVVCPEHAILAGDLDDPESEISRVLGRTSVTVRKPEQGTGPKLFYVEAQSAALDPTAGAVSAGTYSSSTSAHEAPDRHPRSSQAAALVSYDVHHEHYWHWPIAAYLVTKHVAGGVFFLLSLMALIASPAPRAVVEAGGIGLLCLAVTLGLLVYDLDRPDRFLFLLTRPQWKSWIARAAWILTAFAALGTGWWALEAGIWSGLLPASALAARPIFAVLTGPVALLAAIYTAFLFAQAEGRDLWQAPHQPLLMTTQALLLGATPFAVLHLAGGLPAEVMAAGAVGSLILSLVGDSMPGQTVVARLGRREMVSGAYRWWWRSGIGLGYVAPLGLLALHLPLLASLSAAVGVFLYAVALVLAPQTIRNS